MILAGELNSVESLASILLTQNLDSPRLVA